MKYIFYVLITFFFLNACFANENHVIANVPEASGICYSKYSDTLFVANDEGRVYELSPKGKILRKKRLGNYDLEGVACDEKKAQLYFAIEGSDDILVVKQKRLKVIKKININREYKGRTLLVKDKKRGLEGITMDDKYFYLSNQSERKYPRSDPSVIVKIDRSSRKKADIKDMIDHKQLDIAGLAMHHGYLYMVSDTENNLIKYDIKRDKVVWVKALPDFAQEGVTFDDQGYIYFADDNGRVLKYPETDFI
ncbi:SdiA-regulated domain-containing protein [Sulfurovum sp. CS9]|uniref:SdiA-regulated domain-containing protein n=1 Tax=Sulfurovum sp. CS9 TaxID=3391146 RepID=UPI0039E98298